MNETVFEPCKLETHQVDDSGELILHDPNTGEMAVLNAVGAAAYELVDGARTTDAIVNEIVELFPDVGPERITLDVTSFLDDLVRRGFIRARP